MGRTLLRTMRHLDRTIAQLLILLTAFLTTAPARAAPAGPASSAAPAAAPASSPAPATPAERADEPFGDADRVLLEVSFGTVASAGLLPAASFGVSAGAGFRWRFASLGAEGRFMVTPPFYVADGRMASAYLKLGAVNACFHAGWHLPLRLDSWHACFVVGAGGLNLVPQGDDHRFHIVEAHSFMFIMGPRVGVAWQVLPSIYIRAFAELQASLARVALSYNDRDKSDAFSSLGGIFGIQLNTVWGQPARWSRPVTSAALAR